MDRDIKEINRVRVKLLGQEFVLKGTEEEEYIEGVANSVSSRMEKITAKHPEYHNTRVAILTAIQLADDLAKLQMDHDRLSEEIRIINKINKLREIEE